MKAHLKELINNRHDLWCAKNLSSARLLKSLSTQHSELDSLLSQGGWPLACSTELITDSNGGGEFSLILPALAKLSQQQKWIALIAPPFIPYSPALEAAGVRSEQILMIHPRNQKELLWATEQALKTGTCSAVISWFSQYDIADKDLRRIQTAASLSQCLHIQYRSKVVADQPSPAALRITLSPEPKQLKLKLVKQRGSWGNQEISIPRPNALVQTDDEINKLDIPILSSKVMTTPINTNNTERKQLLWQ